MQRFKTTLLTFILLVAVSALQAQERVERTFTGVKSIRLNTASGNGQIKKSRNNEVKVTVEFTYDKDDYTPEFEQSGDRLFIKEDFNRSRWTKGYSEWTLEIPDGMELEFKTGSGNIEINSVNVELNGNTGSGNIQVNEVAGDIRANTGSGNITLKSITGRANANTGSGSIRLDLVKGDMDLNTGSGNIRAINVDGGMRMNTGSGNIDIQGAILTSSATFNTGSGTAEVSLSAALDHNISINTGSGNAILDFNGQKIEGEFIMRAQDKGDIRAPFDFDKEYEDDRNSNWRGRSSGYIKEAKIGNKNIVIKVSTGSGRAEIRK